MGSSKPKPMQTPYQNTNTYTPQSIASTPEAQSFLDVPLDFGDEIGPDPYAGRGTDLKEQEAEYRANSAFGNGGVPGFFRQQALASELRGIRSQGAAEERQADYNARLANNAIRTQRTNTELERRRSLLPQILQAGSSGYGTQIVQPQPGFWQRAALTAIGGAASIPKFGF